MMKAFKWIVMLAAVLSGVVYAAGTFGVGKSVSVEVMTDGTGSGSKTRP